MKPAGTAELLLHVSLSMNVAGGESGQLSAKLTLPLGK